MKFLAEDLQEEVYDVEDEVIDKRRWYTINRRVFKNEDKFFECFYKRGLTEIQESTWFEDYTDKDGYVECKEVFPIEKTIIVYE